MKTSSFVKGLVTGAMVGAVAGMMIDPIKDKHARAIKSSANGVFRTIGGMVDQFIRF